MEEGMDWGEDNWAELQLLIERAIATDLERVRKILNYKGFLILDYREASRITNDELRDRVLGDVLRPRLEPGQVVIYGTRTGTMGSKQYDGPDGYCEQCGGVGCSACDARYNLSPTAHVHSWPNDYTSCTCGEPHPAPIDHNVTAVDEYKYRAHSVNCKSITDAHAFCDCVPFTVVNEDPPR